MNEKKTWVPVDTQVTRDLLVQLVHYEGDSIGLASLSRALSIPLSSVKKAIAALEGDGILRRVPRTAAHATPSDLEWLSKMHISGGDSAQLDDQKIAPKTRTRLLIQ